MTQKEIIDQLLILVERQLLIIEDLLKWHPDLYHVIKTKLDADLQRDIITVLRKENHG